MSDAALIATTLNALSASSFAARVRVFGSVMKGDARAHDVDCVIDLDTPLFEGCAVAPRGIPASMFPVPDTLTDLLALRRSLGVNSLSVPVLNCFVRYQGVVFVPNEASTWWQAPLHGPSIWQKALTRGVPLESLKWPPGRQTKAP